MFSQSPSPTRPGDSGGKAAGGAGELGFEELAEKA